MDQIWMLAFFLAFEASEWFQGNPRVIRGSGFPHCYLSPSPFSFWPCIRNGITSPTGPLV